MMSMNMKRFVLACLAVFGFVFLYNWGLHGVLLKDTYAKTASLWRPPSEMGTYFFWLLAGQLIMSVVFCLIYTRAESRKQAVGFAAGYGIAIGVMGAGQNLILYAVQPMPFNLIGAWIIGAIVQY